MGKDASDKAARRSTADTRSEGGEIHEERVELSGPRVVRRAVKLRFGGIGEPRAATPTEPVQEAIVAAPPRATKRQSSRPPRAAKRQSSRPPPDLKIELRSIPPPGGGQRLRRIPAVPAHRTGPSLAPGLGTKLWPGVTLLLVSIALGFASQLVDLDFSPVRPTWLAGTLMLAGIAILFYQLWPRDR